MFAYLLHAPNTPRTEETDEFFRRFTEEEGLMYAFDLQEVNDPDQGIVVAVWDTKEAAERYLTGAALRRAVDAAMPQITRVMYEVISHK